MAEQDIDEKQSHSSAASIEEAGPGKEGVTKPVANTSQDSPEEDAQPGVQAIEAITLTWNRSWLTVVFFW